MTGIMEYLKEQGGTSFEQLPFHELDALVLSLLSYIDFGGMVGGMESEPVLIGEIRERVLTEGYLKRYQGVVILPKILKMFALVSRCPRYRGLSLWGFCQEWDEKKGMQFAAVTVLLPGERLFLSFRGTDSTIVGWKEDFNLSLASAVPSQRRAAEYLKAAAQRRRESILLTGGHSKGGNLAVYAAVHCPEELSPRIGGIYSFDSPGFDRRETESRSYRLIMGKMRHFIPQSSVIGTLLYQGGDWAIVKSAGAGILQHDPFFWEIKGERFVRAKAQSRFGQKSGAFLNSWMERAAPKELEQFTALLFSIVEATGAKRFSDLGESAFLNLGRMAKTYFCLDRQSRELMNEMVRRFF